MEKDLERIFELFKQGKSVDEELDVFVKKIVTVQNEKDPAWEQMTQTYMRALIFEMFKDGKCSLGILKGIVFVMQTKLSAIN